MQLRHGASRNEHRQDPIRSYPKSVESPRTYPSPDIYPPGECVHGECPDPKVRNRLIVPPLFNLQPMLHGRPTVINASFPVVRISIFCHSSLKVLFMPPPSPKKSFSFLGVLLATAVLALHTCTDSPVIFALLEVYGLAWDVRPKYNIRLQNVF